MDLNIPGFGGLGGAVGQVDTRKCLQRYIPKQRAQTGELREQREPQQNSRTLDAVATTEKLGSLVYQEIGRLEAGLGLVLRPAVPMGAQTAGEKKALDPCELALRIEATNEQLYTTLSYLRSIISRIDL